MKEKLIKMTAFWLKFALRSQVLCCFITSELTDAEKKINEI